MYIWLKLFHTYKKLCYLVLALLVSLICILCGFRACAHSTDHTETPVVQKDAQTLERERIIASYTERERAVLELLHKYVWVSADNTSISFEDNTITTKTKKSAFTISALLGEPPHISSSSFADNPYPLEVVLTLEDKRLCVLEIGVLHKGSSSSLYVRTNALGAQSSIFQGVIKDSSMSILDIDSASVACLVGDIEQYKTHLAHVIKQAFPLATEARWQKELTFNASQNTVSASFVLNDLNKTTIHTSYELASRKVALSA